MINYVVSENTDPYQNLAAEEHLLRNVGPGQVVMFLWQNHNTVVIGRHQNAWKECDIDAMEADGIRPARRKSGGGAVYHDLGNINFSFLVHVGDYDVSKQLSVILKAAVGFGIDARFCGRNDITAAGGKFSGNAFYNAGDNRCHHGTILINSDISKMARYLAASGSIKGRGVDSVRSRVINLAELASGLNVNTMKDALIKSFGDIYGGKAELIKSEDMDGKAIASLAAGYAERDWVFGKFKDATWSAEGRFPWGAVSLELRLEDGVITDAAIYSDAVGDGADYFGEISAGLMGKRLNGHDMAAATMGPYADDIRGLIYKHVK